MENDNQLLLTPNNDLLLVPLPHAVTTTNQTVTMQTADMLTNVTTVVDRIRARAVQEMGSTTILNPCHGLHYDHPSLNVIKL